MKRMNDILIDYNEIFRNVSSSARSRHMRQIKKLRCSMAPSLGIPSNWAQDQHNFDSPGSTEEIMFASRFFFIDCNHWWVQKYCKKKKEEFFVFLCWGWGWLIGHVHTVLGLSGQKPRLRHVALAGDSCGRADDNKNKQGNK